MLLIILHLTSVRCTSIPASFAVVLSFQVNGFWLQHTVLYSMFVFSYCLFKRLKSTSIHVTWFFIVFILPNSDTFNFTSSKIQIVAGTNEWKSGTHYNVSKIIVHEKFVLSDYINDIALIRARSPIEFNERIQPINFTSKAVQPDTLLQTTGWGSLKVGFLYFRKEPVPKFSTVNVCVPICQMHVYANTSCFATKRYFLELEISMYLNGNVETNTHTIRNPSNVLKQALFLF